MRRTACAILAFAAACSAQQACEQDSSFCKAGETPLSFNVYKCTKSGGCALDGDNYLTMDANWRWTQKMGTWTNCWQEGWISDVCSDESMQEDCARGCMLEGVDYSEYGVTTADNGDSVTMKFMGSTGNVGARLYVIEETGTGSSVGEQWQYKGFDLRNKEMTFTVEMSTIGCGINGPAYLVEMPLNGGYDGDLNTAGALYGTGYCDAQCPGDVKFVGGKANIPIMETSPPYNTESAWKACCAEMDLFEANVISNALTPHPVQKEGLYACSDERSECRTTSDTAGCDWATYRLQYYNGGSLNGDVDYFGNGLTIDTTKEFTIVTQFITADGTDTGDLSEIRRYYVQDGKTIEHMSVTIDGVEYNSLTDEFCTLLANKFDDGDDHFKTNGGMKAMGDAFTRGGMTMVFSLWDDKEALMRWLDGKYPPTADDSEPGAIRGTCGATEGPPTEAEANFADDYITFSKFMYGEIGSTFDMSTASTPTPASTPSTPKTPSPPATTPTPAASPASTPRPASTPAPAGTVIEKACQYSQCTADTSCCNGNCYKLSTTWDINMCMTKCVGFACIML